jgi:hypothetical protein
MAATELAGRTGVGTSPGSRPRRLVVVLAGRSGPLQRLLGPADVDLVGPLGQLGQHRDPVLGDRQEPTVHREDQLLAALLLDPDGPARGELTGSGA